MTLQNVWLKIGNVRHARRVYFQLLANCVWVRKGPSKQPFAKSGFTLYVYCHTCANAHCDTPIHVTCSQMNNCTQEVNLENGKIKFLAFCRNHKPATSNRRVSSNFVRDRLSEEHMENIDEASASIEEIFLPTSSSTRLGDIGDKGQSKEEVEDDESNKVRKKVHDFQHLNFLIAIPKVIKNFRPIDFICCSFHENLYKMLE